MNIEKDDLEININQIFITDFSDIVESKRKEGYENKIDFTSVKSLMGDKNIINLSFKEQLKESIING